MSTVVSTEARVRDIKVSDDTITAYLVDGRVISVPLAWSWRLSEATPTQRKRFQLIGDGVGIHWPDVDEDISADGMLHGIPARRRAASRVDPGEEPANKALQPTSRARKSRVEAKRRARAARG